MMDPTEPPFSPDELALLREEQASARAPGDARLRVLARLAAALPAAAGSMIADGSAPSVEAPAAANAPPSPATALAGAAARVTTLKLVAVAVLAGAAGAGGHAVLAPPEVRVVYVDRVAPPVPAPIPSAILLPAASVSAPPRAASPMASTAASPAPSLDRASSMAEERKLLDLARSDIMRGAPEDALAPLDAHRARFPRGELTEEREALAIKALARASRSDEARARAAGFRQKFPQSLLLDGVESDLRRIP